MADDIRVVPGDSRPVAPTPRPGVVEPPAAEPSLGELFRQLAQDSSTLIKQEITLAKTELSESMSRVTANAVQIVIWGAVALIGALVLLAGIIVLIGDMIDNYWASALIIGALLAITGAVLAKGALTRLKEVNLTPDATLQTLRGDKVWAQAEVQQVKRDFTR